MPNAQNADLVAIRQDFIEENIGIRPDAHHAHAFLVGWAANRGMPT
jgi:hypothetical protein